MDFRLCPTWSHLFDGPFTDQVLVVFVQVAMQRDAITLEEEVSKCVQPRDSKTALNAVTQVRIVKTNVEAKRFGALGHSFANMT